MVNLIAGKEIVPELVQHDFTTEQVVSRLSAIIPDGQPRDQMIAGLASVKTLLRGPNPDLLHPTERAAEAIVTLLQEVRLQRKNT
jgi:lipid-A-disaccharide synthase